MAEREVFGEGGGFDIMGGGTGAGPVTGGVVSASAPVSPPENPFAKYKPAPATENPFAKYKATGPTPPADRATMGFEKANQPAQDLEAIHNRMNELRAAGRTKGDPEFDALARQHGEEISRQQAAGFGLTAGGAAAGTAELAALKAVPAAAELLKTPAGRKIALHMLNRGMDAAGIGVSGTATYALLKKLGVL